jgi:hypothetical protein
MPGLMPGIHVFFPDKVKSAECLLHGGEHPHLRLGPADILSAVPEITQFLIFRISA